MRCAIRPQAMRATPYVGKCVAEGDRRPLDDLITLAARLGSPGGAAGRLALHDPLAWLQSRLSNEIGPGRFRTGLHHRGEVSNTVRVEAP